ncbi:hypothetical protein NL676_027232 [Syzygium grande]|nr:hypothetical protein NL676_027232 [Syzygium grande]
MDAGGTIRAFDVRQDGLNPNTDGRVVAQRPPGLVDLEYFKKHYLVECRGSLLVVSQEWQQGFRFVTSRFRAFLLDLEANTWTKVDSLGNAFPFLGLSSTFSMEATAIGPVALDHQAKLTISLAVVPLESGGHGHELEWPATMDAASSLDLSEIVTMDAPSLSDHRPWMLRA